MIKKLKSNKIISTILIIMCIFILIKPESYTKSSLNAISVWTYNILPLMFPFFVLTRLIIDLNPPKQNFMDKFFNKAYNTPIGSFSVFTLSLLSGYPMGAKLICSLFEKNQITQVDAKKMLSFCSVSGPVFMIGTVGVAFLHSYISGIIILIANVISALLNGLLYRRNCSQEKLKHPTKFNNNHKNIVLSNNILDALKSVLMIAGFLVISFLFIDLLLNLNIIQTISMFICRVFNIDQQHDIVSYLLCGTIEITRGISMLSTSPLSLHIKTIMSSSLIAFGGLSIILQSVGFLNELKINIKLVVLQKFTQAMICLIITTLLCFIFF